MRGSAAQAPSTGVPHAPGEHDARLAWRLLLALDLLFFLTMSAFAVLAPCGSWENRTFGVRLRNNLDPGGPYVISSVHFFDRGYPPFRTGHPGTTLQLILWVAARAAHRVAAPWSQVPFVPFWAQHIGWLFTLSSTVVAALHVVSFHALYGYASRVGLSPRAALTAVLGYASSFPLLYYGGRVSPEPLLVTFTLCALLLASTCTRALGCGRFKRASVFGAGAGAASMLAVFTKLHLAYALPPAVFAQVLIQRSDRGQARSQHTRRRWLPAAAFVAASIAVFIVGSLKVDWHAFFEFWLQYTPGRQAGDPRLPLAQRYWVLLPSMARAALSDAARSLSGHLQWTQNGIFTLSEGLFLVVACIGLVRLWKRHPDVRKDLVWPAVLCAGLLPVVAYRGVWHYYIVYIVFASIGFGHAVEAWLQSHRGTRPALSGRFRRPVLATLLIHSLALVFFAATKLHDLAAFRSEVAPYLTALDGLPEGTRVAIVSRHFDFWQLDGGFPNYIDREHVGITQLEEQRAHVVKRADLITPELVDRLRIATVIDATLPVPQVIPIAEWRFVSEGER